MSDCVFCEIIAGELPSKRHYEDDEILAFDDIHPSAPVHKLIISKKHIEKLADATNEDQNLLGKIQLVAKKLAEENSVSDNFKVVTNNGEKAGQVVKHLHYHMMGGFRK